MKYLRSCVISILIAAAMLGTAPVRTARLSPPPVQKSAQQQTVHVVQLGDNLFRIALRYETTVDAIMSANGLTDEHTIYAGQQLIIPHAMGRSVTPDSPTTMGNTYIVQWGDTLNRIALRHGVTISALMQANGLTNANMISAGQRLVIPGEFHVQSKIPNAYGAAWDIWMPHWLGIYWADSTENGIHALPILPSGQTLWAGYLGQPISYGCVVLGTYEAAQLYNWAEIGTSVSIRY